MHWSLDLGMGSCQERRVIAAKHSRPLDRASIDKLNEVSSLKVAASRRLPLAESQASETRPGISVEGQVLRYISQERESPANSPAASDDSTQANAFSMILEARSNP